jgi:hypothetical protein
MFAANIYRIRFATTADADTLQQLAERESQQPLVGRVLVGYIDGTPGAALSLHDGRVIADSTRPTDHLVVTLRMRAAGIKAFEATPSLADRLRAAFAHYRAGTIAAPTPISGEGGSHEEPKRLAA